MSDELNSFPYLIIMSNHMHLLQAATDDWKLQQQRRDKHSYSCYESKVKK